MEYTKNVLARNLRSFRADKDLRKKRRGNFSLSQVPQARMCCDVCPVANTHYKPHNDICKNVELNKAMEELKKANDKIITQLKLIKNHNNMDEEIKSDLNKLKTLTASHVNYVKIIKHSLENRITKLKGSKENINTINDSNRRGSELNMIIKIVKNCLSKAAPVMILKYIDDIIEKINIGDNKKSNINYSLSEDECPFNKSSEVAIEENKDVLSNINEIYNKQTNAVNPRKRLSHIDQIEPKFIEEDFNDINKVKKILEDLKKDLNDEDFNKLSEPSYKFPQEETIITDNDTQEIIFKSQPENSYENNNPNIKINEDESEKRVITKELETTSINNKALETIKEKSRLQEERYSAEIKSLEIELDSYKEELTKCREENMTLIKINDNVSKRIKELEEKSIGNKKTNINNNDLMSFLNSACATVEELYHSNK